MDAPIIQLENVSYAYPDGPMAVKNLSVSIGKGERVAVLGRNGAGKSTFFLLCNGILEPGKENCSVTDNRSPIRKRTFWNSAAGWASYFRKRRIRSLP